MPDLKTKPSNIGFFMQAIQVEWEKNHKYIKLREIGIFQKIQSHIVQSQYTRKKNNDHELEQF